MMMPEQIRSLTRQHARVLLGLLILVLVVHDVFGTHGFLAMRRTEFEIKKVQTDLDHLNRENAELEDEVKALKSDPHAIEKLAREGLGLARSGEVIIKIPQSQWLPTPPPAKQ
jgi:cell division protein FtsB